MRRLVFILLLLVGTLSCREELPVTGSNTTPFSFRLTPGMWFSFDNWKLDNFGQRIARSYFRNTWTVADTGRALNGRMAVTVVIDSTFDTTGVFARRDSLLYSTDPNGDVYQWGFLHSLIAERETLQLTPQWDRIAAFSQPLGSSWVIATLDTSIGAPQTENVRGRIGTSSGYVGPILIDGEERTILSYRVEITKPRMYYSFWITDTPASVARALDDSDVLRNAELRELKAIRSRPQL
ncbi:MAG: hypothetical protein KF749_18485 [Bacteroidetes bacterium]|nr:hypothetical protein [Bacteroidota bacterium]MCW5895730.1 hypothetical protein [Bacteroidota bacterium]